MARRLQLSDLVKPTMEGPSLSERLSVSVKMMKSRKSCCADSSTPRCSMQMKKTPCLQWSGCLRLPEAAADCSLSFLQGPWQVAGPFKRRLPLQ